MKHTKKLAALFLALMMAFSLMAVTAAYGAEEHEHTHVCSAETIQPRKPGALCPNCNRPMVEVGTHYEGATRYLDFECPIDGFTASVVW